MSIDPIAWPARQVAPHAGRLDRNPDALQACLDQAAADGMLGLRAPVALGGRGLSGPDYARVTVELARASGTFAFLQVQHHSAVGFLGGSDRAARRWIPALASGRVRCGISYGWLRRRGPPSVRATAVDGGIRLVGRVPWFTGWGFYSHSVSAGRMADGRIVLAIHPIAEARVADGGPMALAAFEAARTVAVDLDCVVPEEDVLGVHPADWLTRRDPSRAVAQGMLVLGTAWAAMDQLDRAVEAGPSGGLAPVADRARAMLEALDASVMDGMDAAPQAALELRTACITMAGRLAHAAMAAWSGRGASRTHAAQRVYREVLGFTVLSQTAAVRAATVERLIGALP